MSVRGPAGLVFDPQAPPSTPRDAATVLALRETEGGLELYCVVRHPKSGFMGGALVFPGGKVDASDADARHGGPTPERLESVSETTAAGRALAVAALRETVEEAGLLAATRADGSLAGPSDALHVRTRLRAGAPLADALAESALTLALDRLHLFARWVTPEAEPRRFDARFFLMHAPAVQEASPDAHETTRGLWMAPAEALARFATGEFQLAPPTTRCFELLSTVRTIEAAFALARQQTLLPVCPRFVPGDPPALALPGDPAHEVKEPRVAGATRFVLRDGRFVSEG